MTIAYLPCIKCACQRRLCDYICSLEHALCMKMEAVNEQTKMLK